MTIQVAGNTKVLAPTGGTTANVANIAVRTNTFHIVNTGGGGASPTVYAYVGVFSTYAEAIAMDHPSVGTDAGGVILTPNESMVIAGNFGESAIQGNVYVAAITATGSTSVFVTPVVPGSN